MLLLRLWNYIRGYVIILVEGYFLEKFMNICIHRQIFLWDIKRQKNCVMVLKVSIKGFKLLRPVAKKTRCRIKILKKRGMPFIMSRYKGRKTFIAGAFVFLCLLYVLSSFIWAVDIKGNEKLDTQHLVDKLAVFGAKPGVLKYNIDPDRIVHDMMLEMSELSWLEVTIKGTRLKVEVVERVKPPKLVPKDDPCNIVAYRDGVIESVVAKVGQKMVKAGDIVTKGQLLVSGTLTSENKAIAPKSVHAMGSVMARTWYEKSCPVETVLKEKVRTGEIKTRYSLFLFTKRLKLFKGDSPYENYDKIEIKKRMSIGEDMVFPFELVMDKYYETDIVEREISIDEAGKNAADKAYKEARENIPEDAQIVKSDVRYVEGSDGRLTADVIIECIEDIGITEGIGGS